MTSLAPRSSRSRSQAGGRRPSRSPSHLHSDCPSGELEDPLGSPSLGQRSVSLTALQPMIIIQPRMAQLETLEAKMASIEVSLSSTPRRKKNGSISGISIGSSNRHTIPKEFAIKELETLRNALKDKENIILNLKHQLGIPSIHNISNIKSNGLTNNRDLTEVEKKQAEERLTKLRNETDNKKLTIKNLKMALERLDITDNIDVRIQQAELEYQLGREELNLLTLLEETRALQICLEESAKNNSQAQTLYSCVKSSGYSSLHAVEILHDPQSPRFGAGAPDSHNLGLLIDWALEGTGLNKGDRIIEVNGKIVLNKTRDDLNRLLAAAPDPAQIVLLRTSNVCTPASTQLSSTNQEVGALRSELGIVRERAEETQKAKDGLISDNIRLTHRISYLEEQVAELLQRRKSEKHENVRINPQKQLFTSLVKTNKNVTNINITSQTPSQTNNNDLQIFQKGPQVTALVANIAGMDLNNMSLPVRSRSSLSNVSNTHIHSASPQPSENCHSSKTTQHRHKSPKPKSNHHHHHHNYQMFGQESSMDRSYKQASMIVHDLTSKSKQNGHCQFDTNVSAKHCSKNNITASEKYNSTYLLKHYNSRKSASVLDFHSKIPESKITDARSVKSLDFDSDNIDYASEPLKHRPQPPKKPVRLSLHKTQSLQSVDGPPLNHNSCDNFIDSRKNLKRNYRGEAQYISDCKLNTLPEKQKLTNLDMQKTNGTSALKWSTFASHK